MKAAKIVFWNENEERYEMQLGHLVCDNKLIIGSHETNQETGNIVPSNSTTEMNGEVRVYGNLIFNGNLEPESSETMYIGSQDRVVKEIHTDVLHANTIVCDSFEGGSSGSTGTPTTLQATSNLIVGSHTDSSNGIQPTSGTSELNGLLKIYGGLRMEKTVPMPAFSSGGGLISVPTITQVEKIEAVNGGGGSSTIYGTIQLAGHLVPGYTNKIMLGTSEKALKEVHTITLDVQDTASVKNLIVAQNDGDTFKLGSHTINASDNSITPSNSIYECNGRFDVYGGIHVRKTNSVQAFSTGGGFIYASELKGIEVISGVQSGGSFSQISIKGDLMPEGEHSLGNENTRWESVCSKTLYTNDIMFTAESDTQHTISRISVSGRIFQQYVSDLTFIRNRYSQYNAQIGSMDKGVSLVWDEMSSEDGYKLTLETLRDGSSSMEVHQNFTLDLRSLSDVSFSGDTVQKLHVPIGGLVMAQMPQEFAQAHKDEEFHAGCVLEINDISRANQWTEALYGFDASSGDEYIEGTHILEDGLYRIIMGFTIVETYSGNVRGPFDKPILLQRIR